MIVKILLLSSTLLIVIVFALPTNTSSQNDPDKFIHKNDPEKHVVSWQSIFWALFALALYAMTYPAFDREKPASSEIVLYLWHSSPIFCVTTSVDILLDLFINTVLTGDLRQAAGDVRWSRSPGFSVDNYNDVKMPQVERPSSTWILIALGPISQGVKLFGCGGIWWAQALAAMYLSCPMTLTMLALLEPRNWRPSKRSSTVVIIQQREVMPALLSVTIIAQLGLFFWLFVKSAAVAITTYSPAIESSFLGNSFWRSAMNILTLYPVLAVATFYWLLGYLSPLIGVMWGFYKLGPLFKRFWRMGTRTIVCYLGLFFVWQGTSIIGFYFWWPLLNHITRTTPWPPMASANVPLVGQLYITVMVLYWPGLLVATSVVFKISGKPIVIGDKEHQVLFGITNFLSLIIFCWMGYDSKGSTKPPWTEALG